MSNEKTFKLSTNRSEYSGGGAVAVSVELSSTAVTATLSGHAPLPAFFARAKCDKPFEDSSPIWGTNYL